MTNQWPDYERDSSRHEDLPHRGAEGDYERPDRGANYDKQERSRSRSPNGRGSRNNDQDDVAAENPGTNLFISGIAPRMDEKELEEIFSRLGSVVKCSIVSDPYTKESRGFGFVTMATPEDADKAIEAANGQEHYGRVFSVEKARRGGPRVATPGTYMGPRRRDNYVSRRSDSYGRDYYRDRRSDRYGDRYSDRYSDRYGDRYSDRYSDRYGDRYSDRYGDRYSDRYSDRYDDRRGPRSQGYNDRYSSRHDRYESRDFRRERHDDRGHDKDLRREREYR